MSLEERFDRLQERVANLEAQAGLQEIYTLSEAARFLRASKTTLRRYVKAGKVQAYRLGGGRDLRFRYEDLETLLKPDIKGSDGEQPGSDDQGSIVG